MVDSASLTAPHRYRILGLCVASEVALPGALPLAPSDDARDHVAVRLGEIPDTGDDVLHRGPNWFVDTQRFILHMPEIGRLMAEAGRVLTLCPTPGMPVEDMLIFAMGTGLAAILYQRGAMLLHGSAVTHAGRAFVFCGASGAGKSTLAAALCRAGCNFLSDDVCAIESWPDGRPTVSPDGRMLRLYPDSIRNAGLEAAVGPPVRQRLTKFHVAPPDAQGAVTDRALPLGAVYILGEARAGAGAGLRLTTLQPLIAAQALLRQSYRRQLALVYAARGQPAARTAAILAHARVYQLFRPLDLSRMDETVALLRDHWDRPLGPGC